MALSSSRHGPLIQPAMYDTTDGGGAAAAAEGPRQRAAKAGAAAAAAAIAAAAAPTMPYLPLEVVQEFLRWLSPADFDSARLVCRHWFRASYARVFLEAHIHEMNVNCRYPVLGCLSHCPCKRRFDLNQLLKMFNTMIVEWPGSRFRVACSRSVLDASSVLERENSGVLDGFVRPPLDPSMGFECVGFSASGNLAGLVAGRGARRKLYIYRVFSKSHKSFQTRPHRQSCCPCEPGQGPLTMILDVKSAPESRVVQVLITEDDVANTVKTVTIEFRNGMGETYTFASLSPITFYEVNVSERTASAAAKAHREKRATGSEGSGAAGKLNRFLSGLFSKVQRIPAALPTNSQTQNALLDVRKAPSNFCSRVMRVRVPGKGSAAGHWKEEICHVVTVPVQVDGYTLIIITPSNDIFLAGLEEEIPVVTSASDPKQLAVVHHWIAAPTGPDKDGIRVTHVSASPLLYYDFVQKIHFMGITIGYSNGELWFWRIERGWRDIPHEDTIGESVLYRPVHGPCVSTRLPILQPTPPKDEVWPTLELVRKQGVNLTSPNAKAWRLAFLPGLRAVSFVGRGRVILAADWRAVYIFDLREPHGFEKVKLNAYNSIW